MDKNILMCDLSKAIDQFEKAIAIPTENDVMKAGCIQYFEFCFELAWKTVKQIAGEQGVESCNSPKSSLKYAFKNGWLDDEEIWLEMLASRNRMSHTYSASNALLIYDKLVGFVDALRRLQVTLEKIKDS